ncbi:MAG: hypothetical protein GXO91_04930 [FCB group bacterium]|nr:hypothetical protein [FCB group bacterium]
MSTDTTKRRHPYDARLGFESDIEAFFRSTRLVTATGFFRLNDLFKDLTTIILPDIFETVAKRSKLKILSVGCSDGREPYSLAMAVQQSTKSSRKIELKILACDVNQALIETAKCGIYRLRKDEKRKVQDYRSGFLFLSEDEVLINDTIRELVRFRVSDILMLEGKETYDIAVCANLLLYYKEEYRAEILRKLSSMLIPNGYLYVESVGTKFMENFGLFRIYPGAHFFRKRIFN